MSALLRFALAAVALAWGVSPAAAQGTYQDPFAFCRAARNTPAIGGESTFRDNRYTGPQVRQVILNAMGDSNSTWRCKDGAVYGCYLGASGRACDRQTATAPDAQMRRFCAQNPNAMVPNAVNNTSVAWTCRGGIPV